jgi:hypothetical protein
MSKQEGILLDRAKALINSDSLRPGAKAFLLLSLCQIYVMLSPDKAYEYWQRLKQIQNYIDEDSKMLMEQLRPIFEEKEDPTKGFAGEKIAEIKAMLEKPDLNESELREFLGFKAEEVKKRFWPVGKQAVWSFLVSTWKTIDRKQAMSLTKNLFPGRRLMIVRQINRENTMTIEEWQSFIEANSQKETVRVILAILDDPNLKLQIPGDYVQPVVSKLISQMDSIDHLESTLNKINKFILLISTNENKPHVFDTLKEAVRSMANSNIIGQKWAEKFDSVLKLIVLGTSIGVINKENISIFVKPLPEHMHDFAIASCYAMITTKENVQENHLKMMEAVVQKENAEAWFLVLLTERRMGKIAYTLASRSPKNSNLVRRVTRAWLLNEPQTAISKVKLEDFQGDIAAEILYHSEEKNFVDFLREITKKGSVSLGGALWTSDIPGEERKGFWASLWSSGKTLEEIIQEYIDRNPFYASYRTNTPPSKQFEEHLRFRGYGEYGANRIDRILLEGMIPWGNQYPDEVKRLVDCMWRAIEPDDNILKIDFLRNAIFRRCTTVFAADPDKFDECFIKYFKHKLVDSSLMWQSGNRQYTLHYPSTALASMCIQGALAVREVSPERCNRLVELALTKYPANNELGELGAKIYNTGKHTLNLGLPWKTKSNIIDGWQLGIVKNAVQALILEVIKQEKSTA